MAIVSVGVCSGVTQRLPGAGYDHWELAARGLDVACKDLVSLIKLMAIVFYFVVSENGNVRF